MRLNELKDNGFYQTDLWFDNQFGIHQLNSASFLLDILTDDLSKRKYYKKVRESNTPLTSTAGFVARNVGKYYQKTNNHYQTFSDEVSAQKKKTTYAEFVEVDLSSVISAYASNIDIIASLTDQFNKLNIPNEPFYYQCLNKSLTSGPSSKEDILLNLDAYIRLGGIWVSPNPLPEKVVVSNNFTNLDFPADLKIHAYLLGWNNPMPKFLRAFVGDTNELELVLSEYFSRESFNSIILNLLCPAEIDNNSKLIEVHDLLNLEETLKQFVDELHITLCNISNDNARYYNTRTISSNPLN